jgi:hypothetical protein
VPQVVDIQRSSIYYSTRSLLSTSLPRVVDIFLFFDLQIQIAQRGLAQDVIMEDGRNDNNAEQHNNVTSILTADEFLKIGLKLVGYKGRRIRRCKKKTNVDRFVAHFNYIYLVSFIHRVIRPIIDIVH